jgi:hypothetical protein
MGSAIGLLRLGMGSDMSTEVTHGESYMSTEVRHGECYVY